MSVLTEPPEALQITMKGQRYALVEMNDHHTVWADIRWPHLPDAYFHNGTGNRLVEWDQIDIDERWSEWQGLDVVSAPTFLDWLRTLTYEPDEVDEIKHCGRCRNPIHEDDAFWMNHDVGDVCESCSEDFVYCGGCDQRFHVDYVTSIGDDADRCDTCIQSWSWCEDCDIYYHVSNEHHHDTDESEGCCEAPGQVFTIRNDGQPALANDTRVTVSLGAGEISDVGIEAISAAIRDYARDNITDDARYADVTRTSYSAEYMGYWNLSRDLSPLGAKWQQKDGNWTKRFSRHAYKTQQLKVPPALVSTIGNIASQHSQGMDYHLEVTRDLNLSAREFGHSDSCWWQSYSESRCALKSNGGFGLRAFEGSDVSGRAWVLPVKLTGGPSQRRLKSGGYTDCSGNCCWEVVEGGATPTFETMEPDGFVVFNGYGILNGYAPARILAHMAGMTYRKIEFTASPMYVNGNAGYLVTSEEMAQKYTDGRINLELDQHADLYHRELADQAAHHINHEQRETVDA